MSQANDRQGAAYNPITHFILMPLFLASLITAIIMTVRHRQDNPVVYPWLIALSVGLILLNMQSRFYALRLQDRIIRLEESLRLSSLLPTEQAKTIQALSTSQRIGLRFASDHEAPTLALRAAKEGLSSKQIKEAVVQWKRDDARV